MSAPFGVEIHSQLEGLSTVQDLGGRKYGITPPKPHPAFSDYYVQHSPQFGIVWVKGVSTPFPADSYGGNVRAALERISGQLEARYGTPRKVDILAYGSIWEESRDWIMSLLQHERSYFHIWEKGKAPNMPDDLQNIFLSILPLNNSDSSMIIEYSSTRFDDAEREADNDLSDLL